MILSYHALESVFTCGECGGKASVETLLKPGHAKHKIPTLVAGMLRDKPFNIVRTRHKSTCGNFALADMTILPIDLPDHDPVVAKAKEIGVA